MSLRTSAVHGRARSDAASHRHLSLPGLLRADQPRPGALQFAFAHVQVGFGTRQGRLPGIDVDARALQSALGNGLGLDEGLRASEFALGELELRRCLVDFGLCQRHARLGGFELCFQFARGTDIEERGRHRFDDGNRGHVLLDAVARLERQAHQLARDRRRHGVDVLDAGLALFVHGDDERTLPDLRDIDEDGFWPQRPDERADEARYP